MPSTDADHLSSFACPQGSHSFIRSAMRKTIAEVEAENSSNTNASNAKLSEGFGSVLHSPEDSGGDALGHDALQDARIVIDMDRVRRLDAARQVLEVSWARA